MTGCQYEQPMLAVFVSMQLLADGTVEKRHTQNGPTDVGLFKPRQPHNQCGIFLIERE